jgi:hypothetical protein
MTKLISIFRVSCLTGMLAAGAMVVATDIASAKGSSHQSSDTHSKTNSGNSSGAKETGEKHKGKEGKEGKESREEGKRHRDHDDAKHCKNCKGTPKPTPVTISSGAGKTKIKVGSTEVLGFTANKYGVITVTEFSGKPGLRTVSFGGGSITLSSSVANALRLGDSNGTSHNIVINNTVSVKQNADGSVTVTANPPPLKGL